MSDLREDEIMTVETEERVELTQPPLMNQTVGQDKECDGVEFTESPSTNRTVGPDNAKRRRVETDEEEGQWVQVNKRKEKRPKPSEIEIYIFSKEKLPKQFAFAKLLKTHDITGVVKIKYLNPYKIRIDLNDEATARKLESCNEFIEKGWKFQRAMEQTFSYGVIKDVDLDLKEDEILESITCPEPAKLVSVYRLSWRNDKKWLPSEKVRLCFKGTHLPGFVYVDGLKIIVQPYIFPVSRCSRCWKLGHLVKRCPAQKIVCPKCGGNHENCTTQTFTCVNCSGSHMALSNECPKYKKEKRLREIMAEFNCTYRRAMTMYVEPYDTEQANAEVMKKHVDPPPFTMEEDDFPLPVGQKSFSQVLKNTQNKQSQKQKASKSTGETKKHKEKNITEELFNFDYETPPSLEQDTPTGSQEKPINFKELLLKLKNILFLRGVSIRNKVVNIVKCCVQWVMLVVSSNFAEWPLLNTILDLFNG